MKADEKTLPPGDSSASVSMVQDVLTASHRGAENAIGCDELALLCGIETRWLQHIIRDLRLQGHPIGVRRARPYGYFICETPEEFAEMQRAFHHQGVALLTVASKTFDPKNPAYQEAVGQLALYGEGEMP